MLRFTTPTMKLPCIMKRVWWWWSGHDLSKTEELKHFWNLREHCLKTWIQSLTAFLFWGNSYSIVCKKVKKFFFCNFFHYWNFQILMTPKHKYPTVNMHKQDDFVIFSLQNQVRKISLFLLLLSHLKFFY